MTQEYFNQIKEDFEDQIHDYSDVAALISTVEELQQIPSLIEQIFKAGGDLFELCYFEGEWCFDNYDDEPMPLLNALQFILQRTTK